eukprot:746424-Hanusia_phi.AAC.2
MGVLGRPWEEGGTEEDEEEGEDKSWKEDTEEQMAHKVMGVRTLDGREPPLAVRISPRCLLLPSLLRSTMSARMRRRLQSAVKMTTAGSNSRKRRTEEDEWRRGESQDERRRTGRRAVNLLMYTLIGTCCCTWKRHRALLQVRSQRGTAVRNWEKVAPSGLGAHA